MLACSGSLGFSLFVVIINARKLAYEISFGRCSTSLAIPEAMRIRKARLFRLAKILFIRSDS